MSKLTSKIVTNDLLLDTKLFLFDIDYTLCDPSDDPEDNIINGRPKRTTLQLLKYAVSKDYKIGILTARRDEDNCYEQLSVFLKPYCKLDRNLVFAINSHHPNYKEYFGVQKDYDAKAAVIKRLAKKFEKILFIDDLHKNIYAARNLKISTVYSFLVTEYRNAYTYV